MEGSHTSLADRFRAALDACDQAYVRGDSTPVAHPARQAVRFCDQPPLLPAVAPQTAAPQPPPPPQAQKTSVLHTIAVVTGVILLAIGAWFIRKKLIVPMLYGPEPEKTPPPSVDAAPRSILRRPERPRPQDPPPLPQRRVRLAPAPPPLPERPSMQRDGSQKMDAAREGAARRFQAAKTAEADAVLDEEDPNFTVI